MPRSRAAATDPRRRHTPSGRDARASLGACLRRLPVRLEGVLGAVRDGDLADLVLPRECGGCLRPGSVWCARCGHALARLALDGPAGRTAGVGDEDDRPRAGGGGPWVVPHPAPAGMPPVHAWGIYADPLRAAVSAWKDAGRRDLEAVLAPLLAASLDGALAGAAWDRGVVVVVPAPSSRRAVRERGDTPMVGLCERAVSHLAGRPGPTLRVAPALRHDRRVEDQSGLGTVERRGNLSGALSVNPLWRNVIDGRRVLLVDDVVTTGATVAEAARAVRAAGAEEVLGASLAATQRTRG